MEEEQKKQFLEIQINEFFSPSTSNDKKRSIELTLDSFKREQNSWRTSLYILNATQNECLTMFALSVLETSIKFRWKYLNSNEQNELKSSLYNYLMQSTTKARGGFIRIKLIKLLVDIGKVIWPENQPDFFSNILSLSHSSESVVEGLIFLKIISEEWTNIKDEASVKQKNNLKKNLSLQIPSVFTTIENILSAGLKYRNSGLIQSPIRTVDSMSSEDAKFNEIITLALETAAHYLTWVNFPRPNIAQKSANENPPLPFSIDLIRAISGFSLIDFNSDLAPSESQLSHAVLALEVINEILYRKFIPKGMEIYVETILEFSFELLFKIIHRNSNLVLPQMYLNKIFELLRLASSQISLLDSKSDKSETAHHRSREFLKFLLVLTSQFEGRVDYYECLEVWMKVFERIILDGTEEIIECYRETILNLAHAIVNSTAKYSIVSEERFDAEDDDDVEVSSLVRNIDILVNIGEIFPKESLKSLLSAWEESYLFFCLLENNSSPNPLHVEHFNFIVQLMGRMASIFTSDTFKVNLQLGLEIVSQLVKVLQASKNFYFVPQTHILSKTCCEIVYAVQLWTYWLSRFHSEVILAESTLQEQQTFFELLGQMTQNVFFALENHNKVPSKVLEANLCFFQTLVTSVRTQYIFQISSVENIVKMTQFLVTALPQNMFQMLSRVVVSLLLLPWQSVSEQEWTLRSALFSSYFSSLLSIFSASSSHPPTVSLMLKLFTQMLDLLMTESSQPKRICWTSLKEFVPDLQKLASVYIRQPKVSQEVLSFFSKIIEVLRQQAGAEFFENSIQGFLALFSSENIIVDLMRETESSSVVVEKFLLMLQFMVKDPSPSFKKFFNDSLSLSFDHIYPVLCSRSSPDLKLSFFHLVRDMVHFRWTYFFPTLILHQQNSSQQEVVAGKRLEQILSSIGQSFMEEELSVFKFNLETLCHWNEKHNFFSKIKSEALDQYLSVLLSVLLHKSHDLLRELISSTIYEMTLVEHVSFTSRFLPQFLSSHSPFLSGEHRGELVRIFGGDGGGSQNLNLFSSLSLNDENRRERRGSMDGPTFAISLSTFVDELRHLYFLVEVEKFNSRAHGSK